MLKPHIVRQSFSLWGSVTAVVPASLLNTEGTDAHRGHRQGRWFFSVSLILISVLLLRPQMWSQSQANSSSTIRFEDATSKSGINFIHSFGAQDLGSLLEGTGSGCVWFDYNNDGLPDLYVVSGKPLEAGMHPYPLKEPPPTPPHNHLYRNNEPSPTSPNKPV